MIYLIDDNRSQQLESYGCSFIKDGIYEKHLLYLSGIPTPDRADFLEELPTKAIAILFHATSKDLDRDGNYLETDETIKKISRTAKDLNIPFVCFSWGHTSHEAVLDNGNIEAMNKRIFYLNLRDFIEHYIVDNRLDFEILAKGIGYKRDILIKQAQKLINDIQENANLSQIVPEECLLKSNINDFLKASGSESTLNSLSLNYLNKLTFYDLKDIIKRSITSIRKYGYNLYN